MKVYVAVAHWAHDDSIAFIGLGVTPRAASKALQEKLSDVYRQAIKPDIDWSQERWLQRCFNFPQPHAEDVRKDPVDIVMGVRH